MARVPCGILGGMDDELRLSGGVVDLRTGAVSSGARLSETERVLLAYLAAHPGRELSRQQLLVEVFGYHARSSSRTIDTTIRRLRAKIDPQVPPAHIQTVYGVGYRFVPAAAPPAPLIGRSAEREALSALLVPGAVVTVAGLPGVGKSALLRSLSGAVTVIDDATDRLDEVAHEVARRAPGDAVVVASRQPLRIPGERILMLHPLEGDDRAALCAALALPPALDAVLGGLPGAMVRAAAALTRGEAPERGCGPELEGVWSALGDAERRLLARLADRPQTLPEAEAALGISLVLAGESLLSQGMIRAVQGTLAISPPLRAIAAGR